MCRTGAQEEGEPKESKEGSKRKEEVNLVHLTIIRWKSRDCYRNARTVSTHCADWYCL